MDGTENEMKKNFGEGQAVNEDSAEKTQAEEEQAEEAQTEEEKAEEAQAEEAAQTAAIETDGAGEKAKKDKSGKLKKELDKAQRALEKAEKERTEYLDALMRERADFENYKKRNAVSVSRAFADGKADAILALLPVADNLDRAVETECADEAYKSGVELVKRQLAETFAKLGAEEIDALGKPFDPNLHNAIMQIPAGEDEESGVVKTVLMKGYKTGDRVIRHAMVQVTE